MERKEEGKEEGKQNIKIPPEETEENKEKKSRPNHSKRAVKILMRWLESHLEHPYPSKAQKEELCNKTGLSKKQVGVWFIDNRRVIYFFKNYFKNFANPNLIKLSFH